MPMLASLAVRYNLGLSQTGSHLLMKYRFNLALTPTIILTTLLITGCGSSGDTSPADTVLSLTAEQELGKKLFFDESLSQANDQSCGSCHDPDFGFADPDASVDQPVSNGSSVLGPIPFGNRNAPTSAYASFIPEFVKVTDPIPTLDGTKSNYRGGQFLDGRAVDLIEQAKGPFLNPDEMNNTDADEVVNKVKTNHKNDFEAVYGTNAFDNIDIAYSNIATAIATFESSSEMNPFTSRFDLDRTNFDASEKRGFQLFNTKAKCANCHTSTPDQISGKILFTDFNYFNIGTPPNLQNPESIANPSFIDEGLAKNPTVISNGDTVSERGKFRTPTLRNVGLTAPYMHNGVYDTLDEVITHYDIIVADSFHIAEVDDNIASELNPFTDMGLGISPQEKIDLINFMKTLTDRYL